MLEVDENGLIKMDSLNIPPFATMREALVIAISAQHQADVERVRAVPNPYEGLNNNRTFEDARITFLTALTALKTGPVSP